MTGAILTTESFSAHPTEIAGLVILRTKRVSDERGTIREFFRESDMATAGLYAGPWKQVTVTSTRRGVIRGLHSEPVTKLVTVVTGEAFGAYVDVRGGSPATWRVMTVPLVPGTQVLVPPGVCNGFQATSAVPAQYLYCVDREWAPGMAGIALHPLDPALRIAWPIDIDPGDTTLRSTKDGAQPFIGRTPPIGGRM